ncbi:MAG TPA: FAD-dependent oxidoreductase, partial [Polyangiaceae bacterium]|nr:FAD-dependent oxidoreductase [Polyangiaceae bacterium]
MDTFDYLVIGAGSGGLASARRAARYGAKVGIVDPGPLGGTCVNTGCVPKKIMWNAAECAEWLADAAEYGFGAGSAGFDWLKLKRARDAYVQRLNAMYDRNLELDGVTLFTGRARFAEPAVLEV